MILQPSNILFVDSDRLKICDLGIVVDKRIENGLEITMTCTTGSRTKDYKSPELVSPDLFHKLLFLICGSMGIILERGNNKCHSFCSRRPKFQSVLADASRLIVYLESSLSDCKMTSCTCTIIFFVQICSCLTQLTSKSNVFSLGLILAELCVVMDDDKKAKVSCSNQQSRFKCLRLNGDG